MNKENQRTVSESDDDTETLILHAKNLIGELEPECHSPSILGNPTPCKSQAISPLYLKDSNINKPPESVKDTRRKIRKEWDLLKNCTLLDDYSPEDATATKKTGYSKKEILCGVVAYIEVPNRQRIDILSSILKRLGASVRSKFTNEVTHVIFKNGSLETYKRAKLLNVYLVSVLWVEACKNSNAKISEKLFPVYEKNEYSNSPRMFRKFMMHKNFEYDEKSGILYRKSSNKFRSIVKGVGDLNIEKSKNTNQNINKTSKEDDSTDISNESGNGSSKTNDSSADSITLKLSLDESPKKQLEPKRNVVNPEKEDPSKISKTNKSPVKRKLFVKNKHASFIRFDSDDSISQPIKDKENPKTKQKNVKQKGNPKINLNNKNVPSIPIPKINFQCVQNTKLFPTDLITLRKSPTKNKKNRNMVTTYLHSNENKSVKEITIKLGGFNLKPYVNNMTTHVIVGECQRTLNILKGIARGCWILDKKWIFESATAGYWLAEEFYELTDFSKTVQRCRIQRQAFGKHFSLNLFDECGSIYVSEHTNPPCKDLKELLTLCGGKLGDSCTDADIIIGHNEDSPEKCVSADWILDSITFGRCKMLSKYILKSNQ